MDEILLLTPEEGLVFDTLKKRVRRYINDARLALSKYDQSMLDGFGEGPDVYNYTRKKPIDVKPNPIKFSFESGSSGPFILEIESENKEASRRIYTEKQYIKVYDLRPGLSYTWRVRDLNEEIISETRSFSIQEAPCLVYSPKMFNVRDLGGKKTLDGRTIKHGVLYRGIELTKRKYASKIRREDSGIIHPQLFHKCDEPYMENLGIKAELDFRGDAEANNITKSPLSTEDKPVKYIRAPIGAYTCFFKETKTEESIRIRKDIFDALSDSVHSPVYFHCWGGADRTGTIAFALEALCGVPLSELIIDYELTAFDGNITRCKPYDESKDPKYREEDSFYEMFKWLSSYRKEGETLQDTISRWWIDEVGIEPQRIEELRNNILE